MVPSDAGHSGGGSNGCNTGDAGSGHESGGGRRRGEAPVSHPLTCSHCHASASPRVVRPQAATLPTPGAHRISPGACACPGTPCRHTMPDGTPCCHGGVQAVEPTSSSSPQSHRSLLHLLHFYDPGHTRRSRNRTGLGRGNWTLAWRGSRRVALTTAPAELCVGGALGAVPDGPTRQHAILSILSGDGSAGAAPARASACHGVAGEGLGSSHPHPAQQCHSMSMQHLLCLTKGHTNRWAGSQPSGEPSYRSGAVGHPTFHRAQPPIQHMTQHARPSGDPGSTGGIHAS